MEKSRIKEILIGILAIVIAVIFAIIKNQLGISDTPTNTAKSPASTTQTAQTDAKPDNSNYVELTFRNQKLLKQHYEKHGIDMGFSSAEEYEAAACAAVNNPEALHKTEAEDGDDVYYVEETNEFVIVSTDGYIRTYFNPDGGIKYFNRQ